MTAMKLVPVGEPVSLSECPVGLFTYEQSLCLKTEYGNNEGRIDAYIISSGEFFWGEYPQTIASQRASIVQPLDVEAAPPPPPTEDRFREMAADVVKSFHRDDQVGAIFGDLAERIAAALQSVASTPPAAVKAGDEERARAHKIAADFKEFEDQLHDESRNTDIWAVARDVLVDDIASALSAVRAEENKACAKVAKRYGDKVVSGSRNNTLDAFNHGMSHEAGCIDTALAIQIAIRQRLGGSS